MPRTSGRCMATVYATVAKVPDERGSAGAVAGRRGRRRRRLRGGLALGGPGDLDRLVDRHLEAEGLVTEALPLVGDAVEDDVLVVVDAVGDDVALVQVEDRVVIQLALHLDLLAADLLLLPAHVGGVLGPGGELAEVPGFVGGAIVRHFHG